MIPFEEIGRVGAILGHKLCCCQVLTAGGHWERLLKNTKTEGSLEIGGLGSCETARAVIVYNKKGP